MSDAGASVGPLGGRVGAGAFTAGAWFQLVAMRRQVDTYFSLVTAPFFTMIFLSILDYTGRSDLTASAVTAPMLMTLWTAALTFAGEMISDDRTNGRLESLVATPTPFSLLVFGRLCACMMLAVPSFAMSFVTAGIVFGYWLPVAHPVLFIVTAVVTALATAATATALSAVFIVAPGARIVQNTLSFPVYLLGGVLIPVAVFPPWLEVLSRGVYLSWAADLLRAASGGPPVAAWSVWLGMLVALGLAALLAGLWSIERFVRHARADGTLSKD